MEIIWLHLLCAFGAVTIGIINLVSEKGTRRHRLFGWCWLFLMCFVTIPSFWIRELNDGQLSWIHLLSLWTIVSMGIAVVSIRMGKVWLHARFMIGTMIGALIAGGFAMAPGRLLNTFQIFG
jgi:uncharacterized membrane protein